MFTEKMRRPRTLYVEMLCLIFLSVSAIAGGGGLLLDVSGGAMHMPLNMLEGSIFPNYLIPGLFLFTVFGLGSLLAAYILWARPRFVLLGQILRWTHEYWGWSIPFILGIALILWIVIQSVTIRTFHPTQVVYGSLGLIIAALTLRQSMRDYYRRSG